MRIVVKFVLFFVFASCSNIKVLNDRNFYSAEFLQKIESIQVIYKDGDKKLALTKLEQIFDNTITKAELAKKYNLKGIIYFSLRNLEVAIENFEVASKNVDKDLFLANKIHLNLASSFYKLDRFESTLSQLKSIDVDYLKNKERTNYHKLSFSVGNQLGDYKSVVSSLVFLTRNIDNLKQFSDFKYKEVLVDNYKRLNKSERVHVLNEHYKQSPVAIAYLSKQEAMFRFYHGDKSGSQDVVDWLEKKFDYLDGIKQFVSDYRFRVENFSKINSRSVGVIAPLSGRFSRYGKKVLAGVNTSLEKSERKDKLNLYVKDNKNNPFLAKKMIQELVMKHHVSAIVGGLFPHLAKEEYLEARKYGVLYISLSPVYLPRHEKTHLLVEIPGSVESQIAEVLKPYMLEKLGKKVAILYPWSDEGKSYVNELWGLHNSEKINLTNVDSYKKGISDYRESVKSLLGLKFPRERREEFRIWNEIKRINKSNVRIVNVLPPVIDFDWVFIPSIPKEALQIIPTFKFFDAHGLKFVGGPSWINKKLQRERRNLGGKIFVIGNDTKEVSEDFVKIYKDYNEVTPHLVDTLSFESMNLVLKILEGQDFSKRDELEKRILSFTELKGMTSQWQFNDGLWLKNMDILEIKSSGFNKIEKTL
jgi:hypothetical protein